MKHHIRVKNILTPTTKREVYATIFDYPSFTGVYGNFEQVNKSRQIWAWLPTKKGNALLCLFITLLMQKEGNYNSFYKSCLPHLEILK